VCAPLELYRAYATKVNNAMADSGEAQKGEYEGEYNTAGEPEGRGIFRFASGNVYEGEWKAGEQEGRGIFRFDDGDVYEGEFKAGEYEGRGVYRSADGDVYEGEFKAGEFEGRGVMRYASGDVYDWRTGVYRCASGDVYEGEYKADKREGRGVYRHANGDVDSGFYEQGNNVGEGVKWLADGRWAMRLRAGAPARVGRFGEEVDIISLEEARQTAERLGLPLPSPLPGTTPLTRCLRCWPARERQHS